MIHGKARWEGESSSRPFCSRVMKERQVVMKERAIRLAIAALVGLAYNTTVWASPYGLKRTNATP